MSLPETKSILTPEEWKIIEDALSREHSYRVMQSVRSRRYSNKCFNYREARKREAREKELREHWSKEAGRAYDLIKKIDNLCH